MRSGLVLVSLLLLAPSGARAANLDVSPVRIELTGRTPSAVLTLRNTGAEPIRVEVKVNSWDESPAGSMILAEASDLSVFPALQQIGPKEERKLRVGTTARPGERERTWRIFVEELPTAVDAGDRMKVRVVTRIGIPVFLEPLRPTAVAELSLARREDRLELRIRNTGTVRVQPSAVKVELLDEKGARVAERPLSGWYVLAAGERIFPVEVEPKTCAAVRRAVASAELATGPLRTELALPGGACGP